VDLASGASAGALRVAALQGAIGVTALQLFAARETLAGGVALGCLALGAGAQLVERRAELARFAEWSACALAAHVVLGMAGGLYERSALYDKAVHFALGYGAARVAAAALAREVAREGLRLGAPLERWLPFLTAVTLGTAWELFEFALDSSGLVVAQRGLADTMLDLAAGAAGALAAVVVRPRATLLACARSSPVSSTGPPSTRRSRST
jgi:hypothetical protein